MAYSKVKIAIPCVTGTIAITATAIDTVNSTNILETIGYQDNHRISLSSGVSDKTIVAEGYCATNAIPVSPGDVIRAKGFTFTAGHTGVLCGFDSTDTSINGAGKNGIVAGNSYSQANSYGTIIVGNDNTFTWKYDSNAKQNISYIRFSAGCTDGSKLFVTKNEPLPLT